jgi:AcrR family transcriptional regulator
MDTGTPALGLRERKKSETRAALSWAAVRLTVKRGLDNVLVEDIAAAAGVSPRTFNNYFSSKAEAIVARQIDRLRAVVAALRGRPQLEPLWDAISAAVIARFCGEAQEEGAPDKQWATGVKVLIDEPAVQAELLRQSRIVERELADAIAERVGADTVGLYPQLVAAAIGAVVQVSIERWLAADPALGLEQILRVAFAQMSRISDFPPQVGDARIVRVGSYQSRRPKAARVRPRTGGRKR